MVPHFTVNERVAGSVDKRFYWSIGTPAMNDCEAKKYDSVYSTYTIPVCYGWYVYTLVMYV